MLGRINRRNGASAAPAKTAITVAVIGVILAAIGLPLVAFAQSGVDLGLNYATAIGLGTTDIRTTIGNIIKAFFAFLGVAAVLIILYAGVLWMTSQGSEEKITQAKKILINATIGLAIIMSAYAITAFIFRAVTGNTLTGPLGDSGDGSFFSRGCRVNCGPNQRGYGIEYHYPEAGQTNVPRNTKVAITFKKPVVLSTIFKNYKDNNTFAVADDVVCAPDCASEGHIETPVTPQTILTLNTDNIKIIEVGDLGEPTAASVADRFEQRYPAAKLVSPAPTVTRTAVDEPYNADNNQTIVLRFGPAGIGSNDEPVDYRVALRGGDAGIKAWVPPPTGTAPIQKPAFNTMGNDGGYFWVFTTSTTFDLEPPKLEYFSPGPTSPFNIYPLARNRVVAAYFNEPLDPTTARGKTGSGGFNFIDLKDCTGGTCTSIEGLMDISNRYRTVEFIPSAPCDGGKVTNSCGESVFCLPANANVTFQVRAATVGSVPPGAADPTDGVTDMSGNSLDGNRSGKAEGPVSGSREAFNWNVFPPGNDPSNYGAYSDTAVANYRIGGAVDLDPPRIAGITPADPSSVPVDAPVTLAWNKPMMSASMRGGTTMFYDARLWLKTGTADCTSEMDISTCARPIDPPAVIIGNAIQGAGPTEHTVTDLGHERFFRLNDLNWNEETDTVTEKLPLYQPVVKAQVKDAFQNCFFPSQGFACELTAGATSCCDGNPQEVFDCQLGPTRTP
ncbi:MAG: pilin [Patescibacteria group bacterium]